MPTSATLYRQTLTSPARRCRVLSHLQGKSAKGSSDKPSQLGSPCTSNNSPTPGYQSAFPVHVSSTDHHTVALSCSELSEREGAHVSGEACQLADDELDGVDGEGC